jgi:hypothetical protein
MIKQISAILAATVLFQPTTAESQNTTVVVRVLAHDAKVVGTGVGGANVTIKNVATGEILAEGTHDGSTGNTTAIMVAPRVRGEVVYDGAGQFVAHIELNRPTTLEFIAEGPLGYPTATQRASKTMVVMPGDDMTGDGVVLELHGFIVEIASPTQLVGGGGPATVTGIVRMMCGCPLTPGGLWNADRVAVSARVIVGGRLLRQVPMVYAGSPNTFTVDLDLSDVPSGSMIHVVASDPTRQNAGYSPGLEVN